MPISYTHVIPLIAFGNMVECQSSDHKRVNPENLLGQNNPDSLSLHGDICSNY